MKIVIIVLVPFNLLHISHIMCVTLFIFRGHFHK